MKRWHDRLVSAIAVLALAGLLGACSDGSNVGLTGVSDRTLLKTSVEAAGGNCATGGVKLEVGLDANGNTVLDPAEVDATATSYVCNGAAGTNGTSGTNGTNAVNTLFSIIPITLPADLAVCSNGGSKVQSGPDTNADNVLQTTEVTSTNYVCNGATGSTGLSGTNGTNGTNGLDGVLTLMRMSSEPQGANCTNGGVKLEAGLDVNSNVILDAGEVTSTSYACNGISAGATVSNNGSVLMGPVKGAKVCADLNGNGACDPTEPFGYSSSVPGLEGKFIVRGIPAGQSYKLITEGGIDSLSGRAALPLQAPSDATNITPITTLVATAGNASALTAVLDDLSGGVGYDVNFAASPVSASLLALNKSLEAFASSMAGIGLSKPAEQAALLNLVAQQMVATPPSASVTLGNIFAAVATTVAQNPAQLNPSSPPLLTVTDAATFSSQVGTLVNNVVTTVASFGTAVQETQALQTAIDAVPVPALPVGTVSVKTGSINVYDGANALIATLANGSNTTLLSSAFKKVGITLAGTNTLTPLAAQSFSNASFSLVVADRNSERSLKLTVDGLNVSVSTTGVVTVSKSATSKLNLEGRNKTGSVLVNTSLTTFSNPTISNNTIVFDITALENQLNGISGGSIVALGDFTISATALNVPGAPAALELTLN